MGAVVIGGSTALDGVMVGRAVLGGAVVGGAVVAGAVRGTDDGIGGGRQLARPCAGHDEPSRSREAEVDPATLERAAVAAVEQHDHALSGRVSDDAAKGLGGNGGRHEPIGARVARAQVELVALIEPTVPRVVEDEGVARRGISEEGLESRRARRWPAVR